MKDIAAHNLLGRTLDNKWHVIAKKEKRAGDTGGRFLYAIQLKETVKTSS